MKPALSLRTLILRALIPLLLVLTVGWGWLVYSSAHRTILAGFDRKLLALAGGTTAFIDADAHAAYQRRRTLSAFCSGPDGQLIGRDADTGELVSVDPDNGGARLLAFQPSGPVRSLAYSNTLGQLLALSAAGDLLERFTFLPANTLTAVALSAKLDGVFVDGASVKGWSGTQLLQVEPSTGACTALPTVLPVPVAALCRPPAFDGFVGLSADCTAVLRIDRQGKLLTTTALDLGADSPRPAPHTLAASGESLFLAGAALTTLDPATGQLDSARAATGYLDDQSAFYFNYRVPFIAIREAAHLTFLYTYVYAGDDRIYYVLDGTVGEKHSLPGADDRIPNQESIDGAQRAQFLGRPWVSPLQHWEQWGLLKTSSFPIPDADGRTVALAGADVDITIVREKTRWAMAAVSFVGVGSLLAALLVSLLITRSLTRPLREVKESALRIAAGYYRTAVATGGHRETARLAGLLNLLSERLEEEVRRSHSFQSSLHARRRQTTLARALEDLAVRGTVPDNATSVPARQASGNCWRGLDGLFWQGPVVADAVSASCLRARLACLARSLLASALPPQDSPGALLASAPQLFACARWHTATRRLLYATRRPSRLLIGASVQIVDGHGAIELATDASFSWIDEVPPAASNGGPPP
ncbi:MAG: HAMP domain-containing protein [Opitutaceae bacterium]|nr:HAMP domain-containing protein [Opitutaceae bacterium]